MEMHQVRYFLAVARTLNFTRAAEECNVAQPSLTRAILEGGCSSIAHDDLRTERLVVRTYCEITDELLDILRAGVRRDPLPRGKRRSPCSKRGSARRSPRSTRSPATLMRIAVNGVEVKRTVHLDGVAGRQRTAVVSAMMKMLRAYDWSRLVA